MITSLPRKSALLFIASLALVNPTSASDIGPWPTSQPYLWKTNPFAPVAGSVYRQPDYLNNLVMGNLGTGPKNAWWLPYGFLNGVEWQEKMCMAWLMGTPNTPATNIHIRILDQATVGKHGWAVILKDSAGKLLDFGVRPHFARGFIGPHQWDTTNWVNYSAGWSPQLERPRTGADYYTLDFVQNADGTINYTIAGTNAFGAIWEPYTNNTTVAYGSITEIYLNASTTDTTTQNYKWTEFSVLPQVISPPPLSIARTNTTDIALGWPSPWTTSFVVQTNADLNTTAWGDVTATPDDDGTTITVTLPIEAGNQFFRLKK